MTIEVMDILTDRLINDPLDEPRVGNRFYVSSASVKAKNLWGEEEVLGDCLRRQYYRATGVEREPRDGGSPRSAAYGDVVSDFEADLAKQAGIYLGHEKSFTIVRGNIEISGRTDLMVEVDTQGGNKERIGVEFKSVGNYHARKGTIITPKGMKYMPKMAHVLQSAIYHDYWKSRGFTHWQIIYIDRGMGDYSSPSHKVIVTNEGEISVNGELTGINVEQVYARWETLKTYILKEELPPRDYTLKYSREELKKRAERGLLSATDRTKVAKNHKLVKGDPICSYCEFKKRCWGLEEGEKNASDSKR